MPVFAIAALKLHVCRKMTFLADGTAKT